MNMIKINNHVKKLFNRKLNNNLKSLIEYKYKQIKMNYKNEL